MKRILSYLSIVLLSASVACSDSSEMDKAYNSVITPGFTFGEEEIIAGCQGAQVLLATGNPPITRKVMETLPEVKFVQRFGAGVNSIDLAAAAELGVIVLNLPGFCAKELADVATAMIMGLIRNTAYYDREVPGCAAFLRDAVRTYTGA